VPSDRVARAGLGLRTALLACLFSACGREEGPSDPAAFGSYAVVITALDRDSKIRAIKTIREETGLGLADAKHLAEALPSTKGLASEEAAALARRLEQSGMRAEVRRR
jgi:large subunit ribosomal protein L7/L12